MKQNRITGQKIAAGFTLVEMLVVIAIIAILASILIPVIARSKTKAKVATARVQMAELNIAIKSYKSDYERYPMPKGINPLLNGDVSFHIEFGDPYENDGVIGILTNRDHARNQKKNKYLDIKSSGETRANEVPGLSTDGFYIDPFGNEYVITMDRNRDGFCFDNVYGQGAVSSGVNIGLEAKSWNASTEKVGPPVNTSSDFYAYRGEVMIWTAGPDRMESDTCKVFGSVADRDYNGNGDIDRDDLVNDDNILSWN